MYQSVVADENYMIVGAHIDLSIRDKIKLSEYVDFVRLLSKDRNPDDNRLELVNRGGQTFFVPAADRNTQGISGLERWEQAFRVFSNIYLNQFPEKATQLIQYNHIICPAAATFTWDNIYNYGKEFRMHLSNFPDRSWGIILQQAWSMCLKDKIGAAGTGNQNKFGKKKEIFQRFNKGFCTIGRSCKFDHRCLGCGKFGHGIHICRNKNQGTSQSTSSQSQQDTASSSRSTPSVAK